MPIVWTHSPALTCKIAGRGWRPGALGPLDPRVEIVGATENLDDLFASLRLTVAPLRFGAGVKGKVLDSFAAGLPCVMSDIAAEGLPLAGPLTRLIGSDAAEIGETVLHLHDDEAANMTCSSWARGFSAKHFTDDNVLRALREALSGATSIERGATSLNLGA